MENHICRKRLYLLRRLSWLCQSDILAVAKVIFRLTPKLRCLSLDCPRRTLHFWNRIVGGGNAHSYACLRLFLHASTKVSCVGFVMRCPFREMRRTLHFWNRIIAGDNAHSFVCVRLFPTGTQYPAGSPLLRSQWHKSALRGRKRVLCVLAMTECVALDCIKCVRDFWFCRFLRRKLSFFTTVENYFGFVCGF